MEPEAVAGAVNLLHILEHGRDLRGRRWPEIRRLTSDDHSFYAQGMWKDGRLISWLGSKQFIPLPLDEVTFGGGYPNDDGVNLMHDVSPAGSLEMQNRAMVRIRYPIERVGRRCSRTDPRLAGR